VLSLKLLRLLDDVRVVREIERFKWLESERLGFDIGKEKAALDWIKLFGHIWLEFHKPIEYNAYLRDNPTFSNSEVFSEASRT
jgi:hypothetical protein